MWQNDTCVVAQRRAIHIIYPVTVGMPYIFALSHFLCSVISQGKVVAPDRWGGKWNHLFMTPRLTTDCAKNYCNRTLIVKVIVENIVTCFYGTQCTHAFSNNFCEQFQGGCKTHLKVCVVCRCRMVRRLVMSTWLSWTWSRSSRGTRTTTRVTSRILTTHGRVLVPVVLMMTMMLLLIRTLIGQFYLHLNTETAALKVLSDILLPIDDGDTSTPLMTSSVGVVDVALSLLNSCLVGSMS